MSYDMIDRYLRNNLHDDDYAEYSAALDAAIEFAVVEERERTSTHFNEVCKMAERHAGRTDDCGVLARTLLAAFTKLWVQRLS